MTGTASASNEGNSKTVTATCPTGKVALGGGFVVTTAGGNAAEISIVRSFPSASDVWTVEAREDNDFDVDNWSLQAYVLCATMAVAPPT